MPPREMSIGPKLQLPLVAMGLLCAVGLGLSILAARSVFHTAATEVSSQAVPPAPRDRVGPEAGDLAPAFGIASYDDSGTIRLEAFRGHPIVLNFWASWCPPCRAEAGILEGAYLHYKSQGVVFIGIDIEKDTWGASRAFLHEHGITYPVGRDEGGAVGRAYRITSLPTTFLITADGRVREPASTGGFVGQQGGMELAQDIEQLLH